MELSMKTVGIVIIVVISLNAIKEGEAQKCSFQQKCANCTVMQTCRNFWYTNIVQNMTCPKYTPFCDPSGPSCVQTPPVSCRPTTTTTVATTTTTVATTTTTVATTTTTVATTTARNATNGTVTTTEKPGNGSNNSALEFGGLKYGVFLNVEFEDDVAESLSEDGY